MSSSTFRANKLIFIFFGDGPWVIIDFTKQGDPTAEPPPAHATSPEDVQHAITYKLPDTPIHRGVVVAAIVGHASRIIRAFE